MSPDLAENLVDILPLVAPTLATLKINSPAARSEDRAPFFDVLYDALGKRSLSNLRKVVVDVDLAKVRQSEAGRALLARCEKRGIEVVM